jgi:hypothetical protein
MMLSVSVIERPRARTSNRANTSARAATSQGANCRAAGRPYDHAFDSIDMTFMSHILLVRARMCGKGGSRCPEQQS